MFSARQQVILTTLPKITGFLSLIGSAMIVFTVVRDKRKLKKTYHRLLAGISVVDISASFWLALSTWPIPKDSGILWAVGTTQSCTAQGFFTQFGISCSFYNASISIYYLLVIRYGWKEHQIRKIEPCLHAAPILWALSTAIAGLPLKLYNSANLWCWIAPSPMDCEKNTSINCVRGKHAEIYRWALFYGPLWCMILVVTICMLVLISFVRRLERASMVYDFERQARVLDDEDVLNQRDNQATPKRAVRRLSTWMSGLSNHRSSSLPSSPQVMEDESNISSAEVIQQPQRSLTISNRSKRQMSGKRTREVAQQSFLYAGALYITWIPLTLVRLIQTINGRTYYALLVLAAIMTPIQGLPNFIVYLRPRWNKLRQQFPDMNLFRLISESIKPEMPPQNAIIATNAGECEPP